MNSKRLLIVRLGLALVLCAPVAAFAQSTCEGNARETQSTCGGDPCECSSPCTDDSQCNSGCCSLGYCAPGCVCDNQGTLNINCGTAGCGSTIAPTGALGGASLLWGFGLIGLGLIGTARFLRHTGLRSAGTIASLSLVLLGSAFAGASALESGRPAGQKALKVATK